MKNSLVCFLFVFCCIQTRTAAKQTCLGVGWIRQKTSLKDKYRMTTIDDGNFTIQALISLSEDTSTTCSTVSREGVIRTLAIKYALQKFNTNPQYSDFATLGLQLDDVCRELPTTMARAIEVVSFHRPNSVCRSDFLKCDSGNAFKNVSIREASAVVGTEMSFTSIPLASLMSLYTIPQVSPSASSRLLSNKDLYKSFFRTIPSDTNQILVMIDLFQKFDWNFIFAVGSDDDYGKLGVSGLKKEASHKDICIAFDEYIPFKSRRTEEKVRDVVKKIKEQPKAQVVVLFCYLEGLGDLILHEAEKQNVKRIWLTSEAWYPDSTIKFSQAKHHSIRNQTHGILSVALRRQPMPNFLKWMKTYITQKYECDMWFREYINYKYSCQITNFTVETNNFTCFNESRAPLRLKDITSDLSNIPGNVDRLIDATMSIAHAMHKVIKRKCNNTSSNCILARLQPSDITEEMFKTHFVNEWGENITYNKNGDPEFSYYSVQNLVFNDSKNELQFIQVGDWNEGNDNPLSINISAISWPYWFNYSNKATATSKYIPSTVPGSRCSDRCVPGEKVVGKSQCCWACAKCHGNTVTGSEMMDACTYCGNYSHTVDNIRCLKTPIIWLKIDNAAGLAIVVISAVGMLVTIAATIFIAKHWELVTVHEKSPHLLGFVCSLLIFTFLYGPLHIVEPTNLFCQIRNAYFFVLLIMYCAYVLVKTQALLDYVQTYTEKYFHGKEIVCQVLVLFLLFLVELGSIIAWIYVDGTQLQEFRTPDKQNKVIEIQCKVDFTAARLVSTFIPCIILIIATFCAFRERNADHSFYEPKFLSFSCIALCIIIVAFLPTFNYVYGIYKAIVWAFTTNVFGYTFIACLILPKIYVGVVRKRKGITEYPMKAGATKKEKPEKKEKKEKQSKKITIVPNMTSSVRSKTMITEVTADVDSGSSGSGPRDKIENGSPETNMSGSYKNATFEEADEADVEGGSRSENEEGSLEDGLSEGQSPPPDYEASIKDKATVENTIF